MLHLTSGSQRRAVLMEKVFFVAAVALFLTADGTRRSVTTETTTTETTIFGRGLPPHTYEDLNI